MKDTGKQTRAKIIQVIEDLVNEKSLDKISVREICQKANIAVGTFYIYFSSKEEALLYVYHQLDEQFKNLKLDQTPLENIKLILTTYYNMVDIEPLRVYRTLYSCHLNHYDNYYFVPIEWTNNNKFIEQLLIMKENMYLGKKLGAAVFNNAGDAEKMKLFIKYGLDVNVRNEKGKPILFRAIETKNLESVKLLVEQGANLDDLYEGIDVLEYAQNYGSEETVSYIQGKLK